MSTVINPNAASTNVANTWTANQTMDARFMEDLGASVASANDITLGGDGNMFVITGTTTVNRIAQAAWSDGARITLKFASAVLSIANGVAAGGGFGSIYTSSGATYITNADDVLSFRFDGTNWYQDQPSKTYAKDLTMVSGRARFTQGADVVSATNLSLGFDGNVFELTGTTAVTLISNIGWQEGSEIMLVANENVTITNGTATSGTNITIKLAGAANFAMTADDTLTLVLCSTTAGGQAWREKSRAAI